MALSCLTHANNRITDTFCPTACVRKDTKLLFILSLIGTVSLLLACWGATGIGSWSRFDLVLTMGGGGFFAILTFALVEIIGHSPMIPLKPQDTVIILKNLEGKTVTTSVGELYTIAQDAAPAENRETFLSDVWARLNAKEFQSDPLLYIEKWNMHREGRTPLQLTELTFFDKLIAEIDDPLFPWNNKPSNQKNGS